MGIIPVSKNENRLRREELVFSDTANKSRIGQCFALHRSWTGIMRPLFQLPHFIVKTTED